MLSHVSHVWLFTTLWTVAHQAPLSLGFSRQEYWGGLPCPPQGDPEIEPLSHVSCIGRRVFFFFFLTSSAIWEAHITHLGLIYLIIENLYLLTPSSTSSTFSWISLCYLPLTVPSKVGGISLYWLCQPLASLEAKRLHQGGVMERQRAGNWYLLVNQQCTPQLPSQGFSVCFFLIAGCSSAFPNDLFFLCPVLLCGQSPESHSCFLLTILLSPKTICSLKKKKTKMKKKTTKIKYFSFCIGV